MYMYVLTMAKCQSDQCVIIIEFWIIELHVYCMFVFERKRERERKVDTKKEREREG